MRAATLAVGLASAAAGCGSWWESRALDLWDVVPVAVEYDKELGFSASARATPFIQTGLGVYGIDTTSVNSWGMGLGRWGPAWKEAAVHVLIGTLEQQIIEGEPWPGGPDGRYGEVHEGSLARQSGNLLVFLPTAGIQHPPPPPEDMWAKLPPWHGILDCEAHVFLGLVGMRLGFAPLQLPDFLLGFLGIDFVGDDPEESAHGPPDTPPGSEVISS
jgi:hypothetical protein